MRCSTLLATLLPAVCAAVAPDDASPLVQLSKAWTPNSTSPTTNMMVELLSALHVVQAMAESALNDHPSPAPAVALDDHPAPAPAIALDDQPAPAPAVVDDRRARAPPIVDRRTFNCTREERARMSLSDTNVIADAVKNLLDGNPLPNVCFKANGKNTIYDQQCLAELTGVSVECAQCHTMFSHELPNCLQNMFCSNVLLGGFMSACAGLVQNAVPNQSCLNTLGGCMKCVKPTVRHHYDCKGGYPPEAYTWMDEAQASFSDGSILKPGRFNDFVSRLKKMVEGKV